MSLTIERCLLCRAPIVRARLYDGRPISMDAQSSDGGQWILDEREVPPLARIVTVGWAGPKHAPHAETCKAVPR